MHGQVRPQDIGVIRCKEQCWRPGHTDTKDHTEHVSARVSVERRDTTCSSQGQFIIFARIFERPSFILFLRESLNRRFQPQSPSPNSILTAHHPKTAVGISHPLGWPWEAQEYWRGYLSLLQRIFPTQGSNWGLLHCRRILYQLSS